MNCKLLLVIIPLSGGLLLGCNTQKRFAKRQQKQQHEYMGKTYAELKTVVNEAEVTILNDSIKVLFPENLLFAVNSSSIKPANYPVMQRFAGALNHYPNTHILINGYTDSSGGEAINKKLSGQRADTAGSVLKQYGVLPERMNFWAFGMANPIADNRTEEGRSKNRRVEFIILYELRNESK